MATKDTGWIATHTASIVSQTDTTATIRVTAIWKNEGWNYNINHVNAWVYCNGTEYQVASDRNVNTTSGDYASLSMGYHDFSISKGTGAKSISCYAKITSNSSYVSGTKSSSATSVSVAAKPSYTVSYNANGGSGAPSSQTKWYGTNLTLSSTKPTRTGYSFAGWATSASGSVAYQPGATYSANAGVTLYAKWTANTYVVKYDANGGTGAPGNQTKTYGVNLTLSSTKPTRTDYNFLGWSTSANGGVVYKTGATYSANNAVTLYAVWELAYVKPRLNNFLVQRCNSDGTIAENGTYVKVGFNWATDNNVTAIKIEWKLQTDSTWTNVSVTASGTSGSVNQVVGSGTINNEATYIFRAYVSDRSSNGTTYSPHITIATVKYPIDVKKFGTGVSFGKAAELNNVLDSNFEIYARNGFKNPVIPDKTDLNTIMTPNVYSGNNTKSAEYLNCPIQNGTFTLNVFSGGPSGQVGQVLKICDKTGYAEYVRYYYAEAWGDWFCTESRRTKSLWSGGWYMTADHTIELSEPISSQPNGIILVWRRYAGGAAQPDNIVTHFIHKSVVAAYEGSGHNLPLATSGFTKLGCKYLYIHNSKIVGNDNNNKTGTASGITFANNYWVLTNVYGV